MLQAYTILTYSTFMWLSPLHFNVSNQNASLLLPDNTLKQNEFQGDLILRQCLYIVSLYRWQYRKQFSMYLGDSQTISGRRTNQNVWSIINKSERSYVIRLQWWIMPILLSPIVWIHEYVCVFYIPACVLLNKCMQCVPSWHIISPQSPVCGMQSTNRLHHVPPLNHATCSTQGYSHNHKTTTAQTAVRPNHYLAVVAKPCQGEAPTSCFLVTF